jgi:protein-S-isoprenylcysteine O-methyltransferase Ste14
LDRRHASIPVSLVPELSLSWRNGLILLLPLIGIRYALLPALSRAAFASAAGFPGTTEREKVALLIHNAANWLLLLYAPFITVKTGSAWFRAGMPVYFAGLFLYAWAVVDYARVPQGRVVRHGPYMVSRHPQALAAFLIFFGVGLATASWVYLAAALAGQVAMHQLLLAEERDNLRRFGAEYAGYAARVRRYFGYRQP